MGVVQEYANIEDVHWWTHVRDEVADCIRKSDLGEYERVGCEEEDYVENFWAVYCVCSNVENEEEGYVADEEFCACKKLGVTN